MALTKRDSLTQGRRRFQARCDGIETGEKQGVRGTGMSASVTNSLGKGRAGCA